MGRFDFLFEPILHRLVGADVSLLSGKQASHRRFVILIGLDAEVAAIVTVGDQRIVQLLDSERHAEILGVAVSDIVHQSLEESV